MPPTTPPQTPPHTPTSPTQPSFASSTDSPQQVSASTRSTSRRMSTQATPTISTSLASIPKSDFGYTQAQHLLGRAGLGGTPQQILALQQMGLDDAVDHLVEYESIPTNDALSNPSVNPDILRPPTDEERRAARRNRNQPISQAERDRLRAIRLQQLANDRTQMGDLERWWLSQFIMTPRPLEEKLVLLWHSHFASNHRTVRDSYLMIKQNVLFRNQAKNFPALARGIVHDPAMLKFLNNDRNNKRQPNENLAREIMELFTLGEGNYRENDIKQGARALTGYSVQDNEFRFYANQHDSGEKTILGQRGQFDGDDFVNILLQQKQTARFIAYKIYRHFVADVSDFTEDMPPYTQSVIAQLAKLVVRHKGDLNPILKTLFKSRHFYDTNIVGNKIKTPIELVVGTTRSLGSPPRDIDVLASAIEQMGQKLFDPPSVAGWTVGRGWINASTLYTRQNLAVYQITGKMPYQDQWNRSELGYDPMDLIATLPNRDNPSPEMVVDHLMAALLAGEQIRRARRAQLLEFMHSRTGPVNADRIVALLLLITALPEYQLC